MPFNQKPKTIKKQIAYESESEGSLADFIASDDSECDQVMDVLHQILPQQASYSLSEIESSEMEAGFSS